MGFSKYLSNVHNVAKSLIDKLLEKYEYASILGTHITGYRMSVSPKNKSIDETPERDFGFVVKIYNGRIFSEYSFNLLKEELIDQIIMDIESKLLLDEFLLNDAMKCELFDDSVLVKTFHRPIQGHNILKPKLIKILEEIKDNCLAYDSRIVDANIVYGQYETSKFFISKNRDLCQNYSWINVSMEVTSKENDNIKSSYFAKGYNSPTLAVNVLKEEYKNICQLSIDLLSSTLIEPGEYDIICDPSISGLIAHEAFGHGVEMDMFVKDRALAKQYVNKQVASPLVNMHDGASIIHSSASYFFDDDGVLASDTTIIKNGILQTGISDVLSASILKSKPTGNGRRESYKRKSYARMTNTYFVEGKSKVEDMIKSIEHGYLLSQTENGMEDPKNWNIQCVCAYGREIKNGKFTGKIVAPVCMSGNVLDLLNSISMVSDEIEVIGSGHCGKGYKEWVVVSDGGPYLKGRCKLG